MQKRLCILIFSTILFTHVFSFGGTGWNEHSRLDLLHALVYEHRLTIDTFQGNTGDKAFFNGHYYSEKPPGVVLLALPAFIASVVLTEVWGFAHDSGTAWMFKAWITTAGSAGVLAAIAAVAMFLLLQKFVKVRPALLTTMVLFLASPMFTYSHVLFAHGMAASLLTICLWAVFTRTERTANWKDVLAGVTAGLAISCEYLIAIAVAAIFVYCLCTNSRQALRFAVAALVPLFLIPVQNVLISGQFFTMAYDATRGAPGEHISIWQELRIAAPDFSIVSKLLFSESRGLLFWTPLLWFVFPGFLVMSQQYRLLSWLIALASVLLILFVSGLGTFWDGGWALGPRQLTSMLPLLAIPLAYGCSVQMRLALPVALLSFLLTYLAALLNPHTERLLSPLWQYYIPQYLQGNFGTNWGVLLGLPGPAAIGMHVLVLVVVSAMALHWLQLAPKPASRHVAKNRRGQSPAYKSVKNL